MAVTIPNSAGYGNDHVEAPEWAQIIPNAGAQYGVANQGSWLARVGAADREVRLSPGTGFGCGVLDRSTADASIILPASASGSVYHLIHVHRDWGNARSTFDSKAGTADRQIPSRATLVGEADDQPLWLARVDAGKSQVQELIDLRVWGGGFANDPLVLQYFNALGSRLRIQRVDYVRDLDVLGNPFWARDIPTDVGTDNNVLVGAAWNGRSPILTKYLFGSPQVGADSVTTLAIPDGGFPNGVLHVSPQILSANTAKMCTVASVTKTSIRLQLLTESGAALPSGTPVPLSVRVDGW